MQFGGQPQVAARGKSRADTPAEAVAQRYVVGIPSHDHAAEARELDGLVQLLADDGIEGEIELTRADAGILVAGGRDLDHAAQCERRRLLAPLRGQVDLGAEPEIAEFAVTRPALVDERIIVEQATGFRIVGENRPHVAVDAAHDLPGAEDLGAIGQADTDGDRPVRDIGEPLVVVDVHAVAADRPSARGKHFTGRHEPQARVAVDCRRGGTGLDRRRHALLAR